MNRYAISMIKDYQNLILSAWPCDPVHFRVRSDFISIYQDDSEICIPLNRLALFEEKIHEINKKYSKK